MPSTDPRSLDSFAQWLSQLASDAMVLVGILESESGSEEPKSTPSPEARAEHEAALELVAGALNYLFKSLDLIQDGIEDLGYIDDCFLLRTCAALAAPKLPRQTSALQRLADDAELIREFLGSEDYERLERYSLAVRNTKVRGRTPGEIVRYPDVRRSFLSEVRAWASHYLAPSFAKTFANQLRLRSFLATKLPS